MRGIQTLTSYRNKIETIDLLSKIERPGIDKLIDFLCISNYFTSPASTKYHGCAEGGLCEHGLSVYELFHERNKNLKNSVPEDSEIICGLLHDVCKIGYYKKSGELWERNKEHHPMNRLHGVLSIKLIKHYIDLTPEEEAIIKYHMGLFSVFGYVKEYTAEELYEAVAKWPFVQIFAACDNEEAHSKERYTKPMEVKL